MKAKQYTIRNVRASVDRALRMKAAEAEISLNSILLGALEKEAGIDEPVEHHDLDFLIGSWVRDPVTERVLREQRKVDRRDWK